jgi:hypothetical protein
MRRFLLALAVLFAALPAAAQDTQAFHSTDAAYTVQVPAAWRRMPEADVETMRQAGAAMGMPFTLEAGYRLTDSPNGWPFIVMAWMDLEGEFTPEEFGTMITDAHAEAQQAGGAPAPGHGRIDALTWHAENRTVWARTELPGGARDEGPFTWTALTLHPDGTRTVVLVYYATEGEDDARIRADLLRIVRSLRAD